MSSAMSSGLERLLREAERRNEIALHFGRGAVMVLLGGVIFLVLARDYVQNMGWTVYAIVIGTTVGWLVFLRLMTLRRYIPALKYVLILSDATLFLRPVIAFRLVLPSLGFANLVPPELFSPVLPLGFVVVAFSGALRFSVRAAAWSTLVAMTAHIALFFIVSLNYRSWALQLMLIFLVGALGMLAARALRAVVRKAEQEKVMERYVPSALVTELARASDLERMARIEEVSVLFADIRGFTRLSEPLTPQQTVDFLNSYFATVVASVAEYRGVIDKYLGDGVLVFFEGPDHAVRAVRAARGMLGALERFNASKPAEEPVRMGVAINTGEALIGTVGAPARMEYTVIGDTVNVASRLEALNKEFDSDLVISQSSVTAVGGPGADALQGLKANGPATTPIRGRGGHLEVYWAAHSIAPA